MELDSENAKLTPRVRLGRRIRRLREQRGLSLRQLSERVGGYSHSYLGRVELGEQLPSEALVSALDDFFGTDGVLAELLELAHDTLIPDYSKKAIDKEPEAERIQVFNSSLVPGLLQTPDYARAAFRRSRLNETEEQVNERVDIRIKRQRILARKDPPYYWGIMDEAALKRPIGGVACMAGQIKHLLKFESGEPVESPRRVLELTQRFDMARSLALTDDESIDLMRKYLKEYDGEDNP